MVTAWRAPPGQSLRPSPRASSNLLRFCLIGEGTCATSKTCPSSTRASFRLAPPKSHPMIEVIYSSLPSGVLYQSLGVRSRLRRPDGTAMSNFTVIPALDLKGGLVVHAIGGDRTAYSAIASPFG